MWSASHLIPVASERICTKSVASSQTSESISEYQGGTACFFAALLNLAQALFFRGFRAFISRCFRFFSSRCRRPYKFDFALITSAYLRYHLCDSSFLRSGALACLCALLAFALSLFSFHHFDAATRCFSGSFFLDARFLSAEHCKQFPLLTCRSQMCPFEHGMPVK